MTKKNIFIILFAAFIVSCKKDRVEPVAETKEISAHVVDEGNPAADGCGWHIKTDSGTDYIPKNLDAAFQTDSLTVIISFTKDGKLSCGLAPTEFPAIHLTAIRKK